MTTALYATRLYAVYLIFDLHIACVGLQANCSLCNAKIAARAHGSRSRSQAGRQAGRQALMGLNQCYWFVSRSGNGFISFRF